MSLMSEIIFSDEKFIGFAFLILILTGLKHSKMINKILLI